MKTQKKSSQTKAPLGAKLIAIYEANPTQKTVAHRWVEFVDEFGKPRRLLILNKDLADLRKVKAMLLENNAQHLRNPSDYKKIQLAFQEHTDQKIALAMSPGYIDGNYLLPNNEAILKSRVPPKLYPNQRPVSNAEDLSGELDEWKRDIASLAEYSPILTLSMLSAFSGLLIRFTDVEPGGFHLFSESSKGKSSAAYMAASVVGGQEAFNFWDMTEKAFEELAELHNDSILILDELKTIDSDPEKAAQKAMARVYKISSGKGRSRSVNYQSSVSRWNLVILSTGEVSLNENAQQGGGERYAGEMVRLVDVPAIVEDGIFWQLPKDIKPQAITERLKSLGLSKQFGVARHAFLQQALKHIRTGRLQEKLKEYMEDFLDMDEVAVHCENSQYQRIAKRFALAYAAGRVAKKFGVIDLSLPQIKRDMIFCFEAAIDHLDQQKQRQFDLIDFLKNQRQYNPKTLKAYDESTHKVFKAVVRGKKVLAVPTLHLKRHVSSLSVGQKRKIVKNSQGKRVNQVSVEGIKISCYCFSLDILE